MAEDLGQGDGVAAGCDVVSCERVPECVRADGLDEAGGSRVFLCELEDAYPAQAGRAPSVALEEYGLQVRALAPRAITPDDVVVYRPKDCGRYLERSWLAPLALSDLDDGGVVGLGLQVADLQADEFGDAQSAPEG